MSVGSLSGIDISPYYYLDVAFGSRKLKLESGEKLVMPNIVRTVARCTIINQYLDFCKRKISVPWVAPFCGGFLKFRKPPKENPLKVLITRRQMGSMVIEALRKIFWTNWKKWGRTSSGVRQRAQGWKRLSYIWRRPFEITAKRKTSVPTTVLHSPWAIPLMLIIAQIVASTIIFHLTTVRHWRRLFRCFILPLESIAPR